MADRAFLERLTKQLADEGRLIEAGWVAFRLMVMSPNAPAIQIDECRMAYMAGSQHLWASVMAMLDPGEEPTDADLSKMDLINKELEAFTREMEQRVKR
jgi:hypothetical protein